MIRTGFATALILGLSACTSPKPTPSSAAGTGPAAYTEPQARFAAMQGGMSNVGTMKKTEKGGWEGGATKGGSPVIVSIDPNGKVSSRKIGE